MKKDFNIYTLFFWYQC